MWAKVKTKGSASELYLSDVNGTEFCLSQGNFHLVKDNLASFFLGCRISGQVYQKYNLNAPKSSTSCTPKALR